MTMMIPKTIQTYIYVFKLSILKSSFQCPTLSVHTTPKSNKPWVFPRCFVCFVPLADPLPPGRFHHFHLQVALDTPENFFKKKKLRKLTQLPAS